MQEYLLSIDVDGVSCALFHESEGGVVALHGGHTNTASNPYRIRTVNGSAGYWIVKALGEKGEEVKVEWEKSKYPDGPNPQEVLDALKKAAGL